ncbi:MAG: Fe-S protein assembly co-chaperone HscB [Acidobacteria bacterium]|nr:Fe-S protein assembly co-chaperone HscB [Acidobacteriota bacterium]
MDHFSFFRLPRKLNVDMAALELEFYRLSRKLHPDVYARAGEREQQWSLEKSSQLNDAYRTLKDPLARTAYLLGLEGVQLEEQSKAATDRARVTGEEKEQVVPPDMLEEAFELNMQLEELRMEKKTGHADPNVVAELEAAKARFEQKLAALGNELRGYWNEWDALPFHDRPQASGSADANRVCVRDRMVDLLNRRSYVRNLVRDVKEELNH